MDLLFIYGPPAVGKLTIGRIVARETGYRLLHNHLAFDIAAALFDPFNAPFSRLLREVRLLCLRAGADAGLPGMILTMCYDHPEDEAVVEEIHGSVQTRGGAVSYVHLVCSDTELLRRVQCADRQKYGKLTSPEKLAQTLKTWNLLTSVRNHPSLRIDNTERTAESVAGEIMEHYYIPPVEA